MSAYTIKLEMAEKAFTLTTEHAASSYGIPVAVVDGEAYGPEDSLPIWPNDELSTLGWFESARTTVASAIKYLSDDEAIAACRAFCGPL